jgi:ATP synthase protein I
MTTMSAARGYLEDESQDAQVVPLSAAQAAALRQSDPALSPWFVVGLQVVAGAVVALLFGVTVGGFAAMSAAYGAIAVIIPAALFARGIMSKFSSLNAATASFGFFLWEAVKIGASLLLIALAPRVIADLSWLAMLAGLFVTLKMYWLALLWRPRPKANLKA